MNKNQKDTSAVNTIVSGSAPASATLSIEFDGKKYYPPFHCLCCGKEVSAEQFAYGRCCGPCDMGACDPANRAYNPIYAHPRRAHLG